MRIKILPVIIVMLLLFTSINVISVTSNDKNTIKVYVKNEDISFSKAIIQSEGEYISVDFDEANTYLKEAGKPMLPVFIKTFTFPFGTKITNVECTPLDISEETLSAKIQPAPTPVPKISLKNKKIQTNIDKISLESNSVYSSSDVFPDKWYDYKATCGLHGDERVVTLTVSYYPVRYLPGEDKIFQSNGADLKISYEKGTNPIQVNAEDEYDLVVIAPAKFSFSLLPLINHKNDFGVKTKLKTTESIYLDALLGKYDAFGRDKAEHIKYFIKYAIEEWNIKYVLLVGGRQGQLFKWHVPIRYSNLDDWSYWENTFISDLYYADIYDALGEFDDWDKNENDIFAEWCSRNEGTDEDPDWVLYKDELDLDPDVYLGRLACRNTAEVKTVVEKIIYYETNTYGSEWFNNMILFGGDTVPPDNGGNPGFYEGEFETDYAASFMKPLGFNIKELWTSNGNLTDQSDAVNAIDEGAGFIFFSGHGSPVVWSTHLADSKEWVDALFTSYMKKLNNQEKLPICVVGGCHNSQFEVTSLNLIKGFLEEGFKYFNTSIGYDQGGFWKSEWSPVSWSWNLVRQKNGGSIATIGNIGLGWGGEGLSCITDLDGWITTHFFENYATISQQGNYSLGEIHSQTVSDYIHNFAGYWGRLDQKTVQQWALLGDPSLRIGGYPPN